MHLEIYCLHKFTVIMDYPESNKQRYFMNVPLKQEQKKIGLIKRRYLFDPHVLDEIRRKGSGKPLH